LKFDNKAENCKEVTIKEVTIPEAPENWVSGMVYKNGVNF